MRLRGSRNASKSGNLSRGITLATAIPFPADPAGKLESLQATLEELHTAPKTRQFEQGKGQNQIDTVKWPIFDCEVVVNGLQEEHDKLSVTVGKAVIDIHQASDHAAAYPFRRSTVQRLHEIVDDLQGQASSMLNGLNPKQEKVVNGDDDDDDDDLARLKAPIRHMNPQDEDWYLRSDFPLSMQQPITVLYMPNDTDEQGCGSRNLTHFRSGWARRTLCSGRMELQDVANLLYVPLPSNPPSANRNSSGSTCQMLELPFSTFHKLKCPNKAHQPRSGNSYYSWKNSSQ